MVPAGGWWLAAWLALAAFCVIAVFTPQERVKPRHRRLGVAANCVGVLAILGFLPWWAIPPALVVLLFVSILLQLVVHQVAWSRQAGVLRSPGPAPPAVEELAGALAEHGFERLAATSVTALDRMARGLVLVEATGVTSAWIQWHDLHRPTVSLWSSLEGGGTIVTARAWSKQPEAGTFVQCFPKRDVPALLASHARGSSFVRSKQIGVATFTRDEQLQAITEQISVPRPQKARDVARSVAFGLLHPGACRGGLWERAEVAGELDAWAAGIHERLAAAEVARGAAAEADAGGPVR